MSSVHVYVPSGAPFALREAVSHIIAVHQVPFFAFDSRRGESPEFIARRMSWSLDLSDLVCVARADMKGRVCVDQQARLRRHEPFVWNARRLAGSPADIEIRESTRQFGLMFLFGFTFMGCLAGSQAALALAGSGLGRVTLSAVVFDFDAAPALRCALDDRERAGALGNESRMKALMLITSQEKALLVRRSAHLFEPVKLSALGKALDRRLDLGRTVTCFEATAPASPPK